MKCPNCNVGIHRSLVSSDPFDINGGGKWSPSAYRLLRQQCPECSGPIVYVMRETQYAHERRLFLVYPRSASRPVSGEVLEPYRTDFTEAVEVLPISEKASAALSRRCLQAILRDKGGFTFKTLHQEIEAAIDSKTLPPDITEALHALREFGNFAAHPLTDVETGAVIDVDPGEAEWMLDIIERLFDFYFVGPAQTAARKAALNAKLTAAGKRPLP